MGSAVVEAGAVGCTGDDVLKDLDDVFGHPNSQKYKDAKTASLTLFQQVPYAANNWQQLHAAYEAAYQAAGVTCCDNWVPYLGTLSQDNVYLIAQTRAQALVLNWAMTTKTHDPKQGGHNVNVSNGGGSVTIDSPYTAGVLYRNRNRKP
ncbi:MAG TPA: hypothetical protein VK804_02260 [Bradyrhizobium sp.]|jgi:hypothetical protein|uniref:hypothetical protein n=1 Tax=Bradyrhizobium sp. TaxID=376 RepID=UPI002D0D9F15|nr:hypothetical protein [Bradyrhizobium sp.]HTA99276.1 hypothetical protein [Bradyrhizobium sp.]